MACHSSAPFVSVRCLAAPVILLLFVVICGCASHKGASAGSNPLVSSPVEDAATEAPPVPSAPQYTFKMDPFEIPAGSEFYKCQDRPNPLDHDVAIIRTESNVTFGSHHMFAFRIPADSASFADGGTTDIFDCPQGGLEFHPYFHLTQRAHDVTVYPPGVGRGLHSTDAVRMNIHFLNPGATAVTASGEVTISYVDPSAVDQLAAEIFIASYSLKVPVGTSTQVFSYRVPADMKLLQVTGHMHSRGQHFEAAVVPAGEAGVADDDASAGDAAAVGDAGARPLYSSDTWDEPVALSLTPAFEISAGDILRYYCTFQNDSDAGFVYGQSAATNEMCNLFGVYYPSPDGNGTLAGL